MDSELELSTNFSLEYTQPLKIRFSGPNLRQTSIWWNRREQCHTFEDKTGSFHRDKKVRVICKWHWYITSNEVLANGRWLDENSVLREQYEYGKCGRGVGRKRWSQWREIYVRYNDGRVLFSLERKAQTQYRRTKLSDRSRFDFEGWE